MPDEGSETGSEADSEAVPVVLSGAAGLTFSSSMICAALSGCSLRNSRQGKSSKAGLQKASSSYDA